MLTLVRRSAITICGDPAEATRVAEILAEWERWTAECIAHDEALRLDKAYWELEDLVLKQRPLVERIVAIQATTIAGLQVRARILSSIADYPDGEEDKPETLDLLAIRALVRDLMKIAA
jgi:hypothetical protein